MQPDGGTVTETDVSLTNDDKPWTRAWELSEIRQHAHNWSLAADAGLLKYLDAFSINFMQKAHESTQGISNLVHDTSMIDVRVRNVTDRFMTLSDSQFIENRVYDEDISANSNVDNVEKKEDGSNDGDIDPFPKLKTAIQMGLQVLEDSFDVLDPKAVDSDFDSDLDSEDEEPLNGMGEEKIYEPKDPYVSRPLPHLIGSRGFQESDDVGIRDLPSDDEIAQDDQGSISESDDDVEKLSYRKDSISSSSSDISDDVYSSDVSENENNRQPVATKFSSSSVSDDGDLFGESDSEDIAEQSVKSKPKTSSKPKEKIKPRKQQAPQNDLFGSGEEDNDNDLFGDSGGLFGNAPNLFNKKKKQGGLFDGADITDEEESGHDSGDDFDDESQKLSSEEERYTSDREEEVKSEKSSKPSGGIALFGGALNKELLSKTRKESSASRSDSMSQTSERSSAKKASNLFAGDDSEEDDLFSTKPQKPKQKLPAAKSILSESDEEKPPPMNTRKPKKKTTSDLFGDDSDDDDMLFGDAPPKPIEKKVISKPSLPKKSPKTSMKKKPAIFDVESSDDDNMFSKNPPPMSKPKQAAKSKDLFDSDSDDDFFADKKAAPKSTGKAKGLLDSDSDDDLFLEKSNKVLKKPTNTVVKNTAKPSAAKESTLFMDSDSDDFSKASSVPIKKSISVENRPQSLKETKDLFEDESGDEDEGGKIESTPPPVRKKPVGAVSMFGGIVGGGELSAAIRKRRGTSDASSKSSTDESSIVEKESVSVNRDLLADKKWSDNELDKKAKVPTPLKPKPKLPLNTTAKPFKPLGSPSPVKSPDAKPQSSVSNLRSSLSINPSSLLPGAAPKPKPVSQTEISFDKPPDIKTLDSVNKTRARGQRNRRPPTRHGRARPNPKTPDSPSVSQNFVKQSEHAQKADDSKPSVTSKTENEPNLVTKQKSEERRDDKVDLFDDSSRNSEPPKSLLESTDLDDELFSGSLFTKTTKKETKSRAPKLFDDDIFGDDDDFMTNLAPQKSATSETSKLGMDEMEDDDIFGDLSIGNILGGNKKDKSKALDVLDDDLLGDGATSPLKEPTETYKDKLDSASGDDNTDIFSPIPDKDSTTASTKSNVLDDDDIFGESNIAVKSQPKKVDDTDIFGEITPKNQKPKAADLQTKPDEDIFGDDIFSSNPPPKKKTTKKSKTKSSAGASIFDDESDLSDIFAASSSKKKKVTPKSGGAKKSGKIQESKAAAPSVLDDPLSMP